MFSIIKWFFGVIFAIILVYIAIVFLRLIIGVGYTAVQDVSNPSSSNLITKGSNSITSFVQNFSLTEFLRSLRMANVSAPGPVVVGNQSGTYIEHLIDTYGNRNDFDSRYGGPYNRWSESTTFTGSETTSSGEGMVVQKSEYLKPYLEEGSTIENNMVIKGIADFRVFHKKSFLVYVLDSDKRILGKTYAYINGNLNGNKFYPFRTIVSYEAPKGTRGYLVFKNHNQEDVLSSNYIMSIYFKESKVVNNMPTLLYPSPDYGQITANEPCVVTGCSGQFCMSESEARGFVSTCEWRQSYACYANAVCERNKYTNSCGWRKDATLNICLQNSN